MIRPGESWCEPPPRTVSPVKENVSSSHCHVAAVPGIVGIRWPRSDIVVIAVCLSLLGPAAATATGQSTSSPQPVQLDPFDVIAHPSGADERTAAVWVVEPKSEIALPYRTSDLLDAVPGVHVDHAGGPGGRSSIYLRGTEENHTLVLLDGIPLNDPTDSRGGGVDIAMIDPALIDKIAVVRGPASVRYGPEVLGGVVHLETADNSEEGTRISGEAGGDHFANASADASRELGRDGILTLGGSLFRDGSLREGSRLHREFARGALAFRTPINFRLAGWYDRNDAYSFPDDSGGGRLAVVRDLEHRESNREGLSLRASGEIPVGKWTATADAAQMDTTIDTPAVAPGVRDPAGLPPVFSDSRFRRFRTSLIADFDSEQGALGVGLDAQREAGDSTGTIDFGGFSLPTAFDLTRTRAGVFAEGSRKIGSNVLVAVGTRLDRFSGEFTRTTARIGAVGPIGGENTQWRVNAGTAFKPPSFYALAHPLVGNPDLKPESVASFEFGMRHAWGHGNGIVDITLFNTRTRNAIDFDPGPPPMIVNVDGIRSRGAELALKLRLMDQFSMSAAATYTDARSQPDGARMRSRPRWRANVTIEWHPASGVTLAGTIKSVGTVPDSSIPTGDVLLPSWTAVDVSADWKVNHDLSLTLAADNLLNHAYEEVVGFPAQGRRARLGIRARF